MSYRVRELLEYRHLSTARTLHDGSIAALRYQPKPTRGDRRERGPRPTLVDVFARHPEWIPRAAEPRARAVLRLRWPR